MLSRHAHRRRSQQSIFGTGIRHQPDYCLPVLVADQGTSILSIPLDAHRSVPPESHVASRWCVVARDMVNEPPTERFASERTMRNVSTANRLVVRFLEHGMKTSRYFDANVRLASEVVIEEASQCWSLGSRSGRCKRQKEPVVCI